MLNNLRALSLIFYTAVIFTAPVCAFAKPKSSKSTIDPSLPIVSAATQICTAGAGLRTQIVGMASKGRAQAKAIGLQMVQVGTSVADTVNSIADIPNSVPLIIDNFNQCVATSPQLSALAKMPKDLDAIAQNAKKTAKDAWAQGSGLGGKIKDAASQCGALIEGRAKKAPGEFTSCLMGPKGMNIDQTVSDANALGSAFKTLGPVIGSQMNDAFTKMGGSFFQCSADGGKELDKMFSGFTAGINTAFANFGTCSGAVLSNLNPEARLNAAMSDLEDLAGDVALTPGALQDAINSCVASAANQVWGAIDPRAKLKNLGAQLIKLGSTLLAALDNSFGAIEQMFPNAAKLSDIENRFQKACDAFKKQTAKR